MRLGRLLGLAMLVAAAAPDAPLELETLAGEPVRLALEGEAALAVHFWATWCPECREELRALDRAAARCAGRRVRVVAVNAGDTAPAIEEFLEEHPLRLPVLRDPKGAAWRRVAGRGLPANLVVAGGERRVSLGPKSEREWEELLASLGCDPPR